ncbi:D-alanyl-D-alanine carboxypeptidase/D-alanyl-D-alanine endopeptidase [Massilia rhizosphaerae]|uniref:D-alanyl-D-alanine carboxypeptidase/D-alanyl-D-alanine endopeptidase n=1 Tax=Massilia rhizosphaerae TaxID=2784389 RepID=UPI0018DDC049|nr:D-alanyl-D-alanine carboxypeptidase/D-alanyl-D-alanine-endopeptidase [Massilia rhizosphaerae]
MLRRHALSLISAALLCICNPAAAQLQPAPPSSMTAPLPLPVLDALRTAAIPEDDVSVLVLRGDKTVLAHLADRPMQPASTMKLVTTLVGLEQLGPAFRGRTELRTTGELKGGVLNGDLVLRGGADADLSTDTLTDMLRSLRYQGIRTVKGNLVVDRQLFNPARLDIGVPPFDEYPEAYYNVAPDAVFVNRNMLQLDLRSTPRADGRPATRVRVAMLPELDGVTVEADMQLVDADCWAWERGWKTPEAVPRPGGRIKVVLHGTFPRNCVASNSINVIDRQEYVARLVRHIWKTLGGTLAGTAVEGATPPDARLLAAHVSRALPEIIRDTNKPSDNTLARLLFLSMGALEPDPQLGSRPQPAGPTSATSATSATTLARSEAVVRTWMHAHGIDDTGLVLENGAGLSRSERITPIQLAGVLQAGLRSDWAPEFLASIPIAGVDGTMRHRLQDGPAAGRARLKTGSLSNVVALAGYVRDADGRQCVLVAFVNNDQAGNGRGRAVLDALVNWVARLDGTPSAVPATP